MNPQTIFLTLEQVLFIHEDQIARYGGSHGVRDFGLLESAILRAQTTFGGQELYPSIFEKASALMHSLVKNHAFVDGNKRTATVSTLTFLVLNGYQIVVSQGALVAFSLSVENNKLPLEKIALWLKKYSKKKR